MTWKIANPNEDTLQEVNSLKQLLSILELYNHNFSNSPQLIEIISPTNKTLVIGIGGELSYLNYMDENAWPAFSSIGDLNMSGFLEFTMNGDYTEIPSIYGIPYKNAIKAVEEFYNDTKPVCIKWEEN